MNLRLTVGAVPAAAAEVVEKGMRSMLGEWAREVLVVEERLVQQVQGCKFERA